MHLKPSGARILWAPVQRAVVSACAIVALFSGAAGVAEPNPATIPAVETTTLDGHALVLPRGLPARATVLIIGFGRHSQDATTAWEKPVRLQLAHLPAIGFYDMAMIAEVPGFARGFVLHSIRKAVPDVLKPNFVPLVDHEDDWKHASGYLSNQSEAAYVLLVDRTGRIRWSTHAAYTSEGFAHLTEAAQQLASEKP